LRAKILGSAAGGGFPQWNCACSNCSRLRQGGLRGAARSQAQLALSADNESWWLVNASPDLRAQIEATSALHPRKGVRQSPIEGVVLTSADADHVLGLLLLREFHPLRLFATAAVRRMLLEDNSLFRVLDRFAGQSAWTEVVPSRTFSLEEGISVMPLSLPGAFPDYVPALRRTALTREEAVLALVLQSSCGKRMLYAPGLPRVEPEFLALAQDCELLLVDGTFWSDDELRRVRGSGPTAREIGHVPISGPGGTVEVFAGVRRPRKIYIHVNNTNPVLDKESAEYRQVRDAGWEVAQDGWEFEF
jgi:pyrroloquinoline quinone biosynthesis protein B